MLKTVITISFNLQICCCSDIADEELRVLTESNLSHEGGSSLPSLGYCTILMVALNTATVRFLL